MNLLCQGAGGLWTGLGWATPVGGQALIRSHGPPRLGGWGHIRRLLAVDHQPNLRPPYHRDQQPDQFRDNRVRGPAFNRALRLSETGI